MYQKILLCTDGSDQALNAARLAANLARRSSAHIGLVNVLNPLIAAGTSDFPPDSGPSSEVVLEFAQQAQKAILERTGQVLEQAHAAYTAHAEIGQPAHHIYHFAEQEQADLIVMGSRGLSTWPALLLGSISESVARHAPCPVLIVRGAPDGFHHVLIASDASEGAVHAIRAGLEMARQYQAEAQVLNVLQPPAGHSGVPKPTPESIAYATQVRETIARQIAPIAKEKGVAFTLAQGHGHPAEVLVDYAHNQLADLIVVGSRGLGGFERLLLGSVSASVLHHSHCSILVAREPRCI